MRQIAIFLLCLAMTACIPPGRDYSWPKNQAAEESAPVLATDNSVFAEATDDVGADRFHEVVSGDTGLAIAQTYGVRWSELIALNQLEEPFLLRIGQKLRLPATVDKQTAAPTLEQRAAAFELDIDDIVTGSAPAVAVAENEATSDWRRKVAPLPRSSEVVDAGGFAGRFAWPLEGRLISSFGSKGGGKVNDGLNIAVTKGTPIRAAADGTVAYSGSEIAVFGGLILISHGDGWVTAYGHADQLNVTRGQKVRAGDIIGLAGDSGFVQEPQLHFEIRKNRQPVDPAQYLPKRT